MAEVEGCIVGLAVAQGSPEHQLSIVLVDALSKNHFSLTPDSFKFFPFLNSCFYDSYLTADLIVISR